jgi:hypothetical protein
MASAMIERQEFPVQRNRISMGLFESKAVTIGSTPNLPPARVKAREAMILPELLDLQRETHQKCAGWPRDAIGSSPKTSQDRQARRLTDLGGVGSRFLRSFFGIGYSINAA